MSFLVYALSSRAVGPHPILKEFDPVQMINQWKHQLMLVSGLILGAISYHDYIDRPVQTLGAAASYASMVLMWRIGRLRRQVCPEMGS